MLKVALIFALFSLSLCTAGKVPPGGDNAVKVPPGGDNAVKVISVTKTITISGKNKTTSVTKVSGTIKGDTANVNTGKSIQLHNGTVTTEDNIRESATGQDATADLKTETKVKSVSGKKKTATSETNQVGSVKGSDVSLGATISSDVKDGTLVSTSGNIEGQAAGTNATGNLNSETVFNTDGENYRPVTEEVCDENVLKENPNPCNPTDPSNEENEEDVVDQTDGEPTCYDMTPCKRDDPFTGRVCKKGFYRHNRICVRFCACPDVCSANKHEICAEETTIEEPTCDDVDLCKRLEPFTGCVCEEGYVRHEGACILRCECPKKCLGKNEVWVKNPTLPEATCINMTPVCNKGQKLNSECRCMEGFYRDGKSGKCVSYCNCPNIDAQKKDRKKKYEICVENEWKSELSCNSRTAVTLKIPFSGWRCQKGFFRDSKKRCVKSQECC